MKRHPHVVLTVGSSMVRSFGYYVITFAFFGLLSLPSFSQTIALTGFYKNNLTEELDAAVSPDGSYLVTYSTRDLILWSVAAQNQIRYFSTADNQSVTFSKDGRYLSWISFSGTDHRNAKVTIVDLATGKDTVLIEEVVEKPGSMLKRISFDDSGKYVKVEDPGGTSFRINLSEGWKKELLPHGLSQAVTNDVWVNLRTTHDTIHCSLIDIRRKIVLDSIAFPHIGGIDDIFHYRFDKVIVVGSGSMHFIIPYGLKNRKFSFQQFQVNDGTLRADGNSFIGGKSLYATPLHLKSMKAFNGRTRRALIEHTYGQYEVADVDEREDETADNLRFNSGRCVDIDFHLSSHDELVVVNCEDSLAIISLADNRARFTKKYFGFKSEDRSWKGSVRPKIKVLDDERIFINYGGEGFELFDYRTLMTVFKRKYVVEEVPDFIAERGVLRIETESGFRAFDLETGDPIVPVALSAADTLTIFSEAGRIRAHSIIEQKDVYEIWHDSNKMRYSFSHMADRLVLASKRKIYVHDLRSGKRVSEIAFPREIHEVAINNKGQVAGVNHEYTGTSIYLTKGRNAVSYQQYEVDLSDVDAHELYWVQFVKNDSTLALARYHYASESSFTVDLISIGKGRAYVVNTLHGILRHVSSNLKYALFQKERSDVYNVIDLTTLDTIRTFVSPAIDAQLSSDGKYVVTRNRDKSIGITGIFEKSIALRLWVIDNQNWVVLHPSGLFDNSQAAGGNLCFVVGADVIQFNQLKERYYEPGLWRKVMAGQKLRDVSFLKEVELPPDVRLGQVDHNTGNVDIEVINRGGGIGEVSVFINGKEAIRDVRPKGFKLTSSKLITKINVKTQEGFVAGTENTIVVKAWNSSQWIVSRGAKTTYKKDGGPPPVPSIYILVCGVSDYEGQAIDLKFAAKDAEDVARALKLGAENLVGEARVHVYSLTTNEKGERFPTKANIEAVMRSVTLAAQPHDLVVMYLSGHGIAIGENSPEWYYLTADARSGDGVAYKDEALRRRTAISASELAEIFKKIPALKQVLMIDACASGQLVDNLMTRRSVESNSLRAIDRMAERAGLHVITGCTADAVSYEASKYGQGVLTYSLLEGIRGAALREELFIDVSRLFQYAADRVPILAAGVGGIQRPQIFSPAGSESFDIGLLESDDKKNIPIAPVRPVYIRSNFIDDDQLEDDLQLGKKIDDALNELALKKDDPSVIFVDVRQYPEGCKLSGRYTQKDGVIYLKLRRRCEGVDVSEEISATTVETLVTEVVNKLLN